MSQGRYGSQRPEPPSPRAMILRAVILLALLAAVVLFSDRAGRGLTGCLALFGNG